MGDRTMPNTDDLYEILQVHPSAEPEVIKAAFDKLALKYHPDVNKSDQADGIMKTLIRAYKVLSDPAKRLAYDLERISQRRNTEKKPTGQSRTWGESKRDDDVSDVPYGERVSQLFSAVRSGDTKKVRAIISSGVDVNVRDNARSTPLHVAALEGNTKVVGELIRLGAYVDATSANGYTPLDLASVGGHDNTVSALMAAGASTKDDRRIRTPYDLPF